jgi:peptidyl-prolyl cis-trans isomerase C
MRMQTKSFVFSILVFFIGMIALSGPARSAEKQNTSKKSSSGIVATVNGATIARTDLDRAMKFMLAQPGAPKALTSEQKKTAETSVLNQLISAELLYQAGKKLEIKDIEKQVDAKTAQGKARFQSAAAYEKALKDLNMTEKDLKEFARKDIYINNLIEKNIATKVTITEADAKKFYDSNKDQFKYDEMVKTSHILIGADAKTSAEDRKKAKEKAEALLKRVKAGEDFATLAKQNSTCPSAPQGGDLGFISKGQTVPSFENAAYSLKPGETSDVIESQFGYHIIKVTERKPAGVADFSEAKQKIIEYLKMQQIQKDIAEYVEKLRKSAKIEIKLT